MSKQMVSVEITDVVGGVDIQTEECAVDYVRRAIDAYQLSERVSLYKVRPVPTSPTVAENDYAAALKAWREFIAERNHNVACLEEFVPWCKSRIRAIGGQEVEQEKTCPLTVQGLCKDPSCDCPSMKHVCTFHNNDCEYCNGTGKQEDK